MSTAADLQPPAGPDDRPPHELSKELFDGLPTVLADEPAHELADDPSDGAGGGTRRTRERAWFAVPLLRRLHFYAGVLVAPFLVVAALTGLAYVFTPQLDSLVYADELRVAAVAGPARPLAEQVASARAAHPTGTLTTVIPATAPDTTTQVVFALPELGDRQHTVYVDPYTARVRGTLVTWFGSTPLTTWLDDLHRNLHLGWFGRMYSELAASWLWVLVAGGLVLWLRQHRRGRSRLRRALLPDLAARNVRRTRGLHAATGVWLSVGLLVLSATGLTWSRWAGAHFDTALTALDAKSPTLDLALPEGAPGPHGQHHSAGADPTAIDPATVERVLGHARQAGLTGPVEIITPAEPGLAWTVTQADYTWPVRLDQLAVDPVTGPVARSDFADWPLLAQLSKLGIQAHMGRLFGWVNQVLLGALAIGLLCVIVWGYRMWWQRRPTRSDRRTFVGPPPERGTWRLLPRPLLVLALLLVAALAWALPTFGATLLAFLVLDALLARRRATVTPAPPAPPAGRE
ncbi:PepSY-associated TM helix domain-containing protein [Micromonospora sp. NPDC004704]